MQVCVCVCRGSGSCRMRDGTDGREKGRAGRQTDCSDERRRAGSFSFVVLPWISLDMGSSFTGRTCITGATLLYLTAGKREREKLGPSFTFLYFPHERISFTFISIHFFALRPDRLTLSCPANLVAPHARWAPAKLAVAVAALLPAARGRLAVRG